MYVREAGSPRGVMVKILNYGFKLQLRYYVHFQTKILDKGTNPLIPPTMGYCIIAVLQQEGNISNLSPMSVVDIKLNYMMVRLLF